MRQKQSLSVFSVVGFGAVAVLAVMVLLSYVQLTALSAQTVSLQNELAQLEEENVVLTAQYERMFDLNTIKEEAEPGILGQLLESLHHGVYAVVEYFD